MKRTTTSASDLGRIVAHLCAIEDAVAQRTEPLPFGTAVFHPGVPWVREVNVVRVETTARSVTAAELAHAARERFPALPAVEILHEPLGAEVDDALKRLSANR